MSPPVRSVVLVWRPLYRVMASTHCPLQLFSAHFSMECDVLFLVCLRPLSVDPASYLLTRGGPGMPTSTSKGYDAHKRLDMALPSTSRLHMFPCCPLASARPPASRRLMHREALHDHDVLSYVSMAAGCLPCAKPCSPTPRHSPLTVRHRATLSLVSQVVRRITCDHSRASGSRYIACGLGGSGALTKRQPVLHVHLTPLA